MADKQPQQQQNPLQTSNTFEGGMYRDTIDLLRRNSTYYHCRNGVKNLPDGQQGAISTESANVLCTLLPYTLIGSIYLTADQWMVFLTDNTTSEIGIFHETSCSYTTVTGPQTCPGFSKDHLIIGASRRGFDCGFDVYWSDGGFNPDRFINTAKVPFIQTCATTGGCITCVDTTVLDCEKLRLAPHFVIPCLGLAKSQGSGQLLNGTYQVAVRYAINSIACTDFVALSPLIGIWDHNNIAGAIKLTLQGTDTNTFQEMEVVLILEINSQVEARSLGIYSTSQSTIYIDDIDQTLTIVLLSILPLNTPAIESSDTIYNVAQFLTRVGPRTAPEFNYQPLANQIRAWWACIEYNDQYYHRGGDQFGMNVGNMRDEVYAYYIRWVRLSGDKTVSYVIPGLPAGTLPTFFFGGPSTNDTGTTIAHGRMAGYSSTEIYPDRSPAVWAALCGQPIMHHKFPDQTLNPELTHFTNNFTIRVMGVYFDNIQLPVDNNGNIIGDIQGYEILRAVREGHKSVIAKGQVNHMREYIKEGGGIGLYQNYPHDDLRPDYYLTSTKAIGTIGGTFDNHGEPLTGVRSDIVSFHSPDTVFDRPNLGGGGTLALYQIHTGTSTGTFHVPYKHPQFKLLTDLSSLLTNIITAVEILIEAINVISGGATNLQFAATQDLPFVTPLGVTSFDEGSFGTIGDATYAALVAANAIAAVLLLPLKAKILQEQILNVITGMVPSHQYALQYDSHGFYNTPVTIGSQVDYNVVDYQYVKGYLQTFLNLDVNNLYRNNYLILGLNGPIPNFPQPLEDRSRFILGMAPITGTFGPMDSPIVSWYGGYKVNQPTQYGQYDSVKQVPISCVQRVDVTSTATYTSPVLFGGDTYINRYTEKNPFFFFNDWLGVDGAIVPTDLQYDYTNYENIPYPRYWINNSKVYYDIWMTVSRNYHLDEYDGGPVFSFWVHGGYFYLFCNGVRDFYVESEVNIGYRDWEDDQAKRFYDPYGYTTLEYMFRSDIIKSDIFYKYDYSLSASRFFNQYLSWGTCIPRDYDPVLAYTCFSYYPRRIQYSLPQDEENKKDNWRIFLPNNKVDLPTTVTAIKEAHKSGALIMLKDEAPLQYMGADNLVTGEGVKVTVGDGGLFNQTLQSVSNVDVALAYGSCQNRLSIVSTPHGIFWVSRDSGKVFNFTGEAGMQDISPGLKWHLARYLPSQLLQQYPNYPLADNPLTGIGIQCIYDNTNETLYICKKDYKALTPNEALPGFLQYVPGDGWVYNDDTLKISYRVDINNPLYFEPCGWTLSYDCPSKQWVGFQDWQPALNIPAKTHFLTTNTQTNAGSSLWRHNQVTGLFCNYYGVDYPFEIEYRAVTGAQVTTLEGIEYILNSSNYKADMVDKFSMYFNTFDECIISNDEQATPLLFLVPRPWDDPYASNNFPDFTSPLGVGILQTKVENKFRFNFIKDFTQNRSQFGFSMVQFWATQENGYIRTINPLYLDLAKPWDQQKKIRQKNASVFLRRRIVGFNSLSLYMASSKNTISPR